jgi:hypothetical protein
VAGNEFGDLADVHLEQAAPDDEASHARQHTGRRKTGQSVTARARWALLHSGGGAGSNADRAV